MPILTLQKRARELGRIRIGKKGDKGQPQKLDRFRVTSASQTLVEKVAELYGGTAQPWDNGGVAQWEVLTDARRIPIMVPPQPVSQWLETWAGGSKGCVHRCDGETNYLTGDPCDPDDPDHINAKPTTRLNVVLRDVEGIGVFRLESHGWNAAVELPDMAAFLAQAGGYVNGWLSLEERVSKSDGQTRRFIVPLIEIDVTPAELMAGKGRIQAPEIEGPVQAAPAAIAGPRPDYMGLADVAPDLDTVRSIWREAVEKGHMDDALKAYLTDRGNVLQGAAAAVPPAVEPDAEGVPDAPQAGGDADAVWQQIVTTAGRLGWGTEQLTSDFKDRMGFIADEATAEDLSAYLELIQAEVTAA